MITTTVNSSSIVFSGIQPSGALHLGNYLGAVKSWLHLQEKAGTCLFSVVDLHAITVPCNPIELHTNVTRTLALYIACGIDPNKSHIFVQSELAEHTQLAWLLGTKVPLGWLDRMTQFKDKAQNARLQCLGLYSYPVLMAADILLYRTTHVPVGEDQKQHIELTRDIAQAFNAQFGKSIFVLPEPIIPQTGARVMSLRDGKVKMSKSDPSEYSRIGILDPADTIRVKINKSKSDSEVGFDPFSLENRPEASNLISIYSNITGLTKEQICEHCSSFSELKRQLIDALIALLEPIQKKFKAINQDISYMSEITKLGMTGARKLSCLGEINALLGLANSNTSLKTT